MNNRFWASFHNMCEEQFYLWCSRMLVCFFITGILLPFDIQAQTNYTWHDCVDEALRSHPDIISSRERINQSRAIEDSAGSPLSPQVGLNAGITPFGESSSGTSEHYSYGISGSQLLYDGSKTRNQVNEARQNSASAQFSYLTTSSNVRLRLRYAFVNLLKEQELLKITSDIALRRRDSLELIRLRYEAGREHKGALLTAEANLAQAEAEVAQARRSIDLAQRRLNKELGRKQFLPVQIEDTPEISDAQKEKPDFEQLAATTPFLLELTARKESASYSVLSAKADYFPKVYAMADAGRSEASWPPGNSSWSAGVTVSLPLFDGGNRRASVNRAESVLAQAQADERSGRDSVILALNEAWVRLQDAMDNAEVQKKFLESAVTRAKISEAQYSNGLISFDDWIIIEDTLVRSKKSSLEAQVSAITAEADWVQAKGGTLDNEK
ncbi:MAG: TolC family protein [Nitrospirae bacterium]|nr:TolC family protein [Nitrospirota bacterium]